MHSCSDGDAHRSTGAITVVLRLVRIQEES